MPRSQRVTSIGNILNLVITAIIRLGKVGRWTHNHICRHFRMNVAEDPHYSRLRKREGTSFTFGPGSKIVPRFLVTIDRRPKSIVLHGITVQEIHGSALSKLVRSAKSLPIEQLLKVSEVASPDELKELRADSDAQAGQPWEVA